MNNQDQSTDANKPAESITKPVMMPVFAAFVELAFKHGFIPENDDEETGLPVGRLHNFSSNEDKRIWVHSLFDGHQETTERFVVIDRFSKNQFTPNDESVYKRTNFYRGSFDLKDLEFFEKLLLSIFPKPVYPLPY